MNNLIQAIRESLEAENYLSALLIALIIPDICGKLIYPTEGNRTRYSKRYDEFIFKYENPPLDNKMAVYNFFDGNVIYKLRLAFSHEGSLDIEDDYRKIHLINSSHKFKFILTSSDGSAFLKMYDREIRKKTLTWK